MVEVLVELGKNARFGAVVRAESILRAVAIAKACHPDVWVVHPIHPESFFARDAAALAYSFEPKSAAA